jgi:hypothetical protein
MPIKRVNDWSKLVNAFETSGLTQTKFCEKHKLNPKYFSLKRSQILSEAGSSAFQKVTLDETFPAPIPLTINIGRCKIQCPTSMSIQQITALVQGLL